MKTINVTQKRLGVYDIEFANFGKDFTVTDHPTNKPFIAHGRNAEDDVTFIIKDNEPSLFRSIFRKNNKNPNHFLVEGQRRKKENEEDEEFEGDIIKIQFPSNGSNTIEIDVDEFDPSKREQIRKEREEARKEVEEKQKKWDEMTKKKRKWQHLDKFMKFVTDNTNLDSKIDQIDIGGRVGWCKGCRMNFLIREPFYDMRSSGIYFQIFAENKYKNELRKLEKTLNKLFCVTGYRSPYRKSTNEYGEPYAFHLVTYEIGKIPEEILKVTYEPVSENWNTIMYWPSPLEK